MCQFISFVSNQCSPPPIRNPPLQFDMLEERLQIHSRLALRGTFLAEGVVSQCKPTPPSHPALLSAPIRTSHLGLTCHSRAAVTLMRSRWSWGQGERKCMFLHAFESICPQVSKMHVFLYFVHKFDLLFFFGSFCFIFCTILVPGLTTDPHRGGLSPKTGLCHFSPVSLRSGRSIWVIFF